MSLLTTTRVRAERRAARRAADERWYRNAATAEARAEHIGRQRAERATRRAS